MLHVDQVSKTLRRKQILAEVSLSLDKGRRLALLGPSGSGKTTLLRLLAGFEPPSAGSISWNQAVLAGHKGEWVAPEVRRFAMVFQEPSLFPHLNVGANVRFGLPEGEESWYETLLKEFDIGAIVNRRVSTLSGGERQRVTLARALAAKPDLLLLDEPFAAIDRMARHELIQALNSLLRRQSTTVVLVTHDARDALDFGVDTLCVIHQGRVVKSGTPDEIIRDSSDLWLQKFLMRCFGGELPT